MSEGLRGVVVSHGGLCQALVDAVQAITGDVAGLVAVSNAGASRETLLARLAAAVGTGPAVLFVDMHAGSCLQAAVTELRSRSGLVVVSGVNLPMLLDFVFHRDLPAAEAAERAAQAGGQAIRMIEP